MSNVVRQYQHVVKIVNNKFFKLSHFCSYDYKGSADREKARDFLIELEELRNVLPVYEDGNIMMLPLNTYERKFEEAEVVDMLEIDGEYVKAAYIYPKEEDAFGLYDTDRDECFSTEELSDEERLLGPYDDDYELERITAESYRFWRDKLKFNEGGGVLIVYTAPV